MVSIRVFAPSCMLHGPDTETTKSKCVCITLTTEREYRGDEQSHEGVLKSGRISFQVISLSALWHLSSEDPLVSLSAFIAHGVLRGSSRVLLPSQTANCPSPLSRRAAGVRDVCGPERWLGKKQKQKQPRSRRRAVGWRGGANICKGAR